MRNYTYYEDEKSGLYFSRRFADDNEIVLEVFLHTPEGYFWQWDGFLQPDEKSKNNDLYGELHAFEEAFGGTGIMNISGEDLEDKALSLMAAKTGADCKAEFFMEDRRDNYLGTCETFLHLTNSETSTIEKILKINVCGDLDLCPEVFTTENVEVA